MSDDIHTVVKQSLISFEKILSILLDHQSQWFYKRDSYMELTIQFPEDLPIEYEHFESPVHVLEQIFEKLNLVSENKYWLIRNKYCQLVATINYDALEETLGHDKAHVIKVN